MSCAEHRLREHHSRNGAGTECFEADIVSDRISSILQAKSFAPPMLSQIHQHLFDGLFKDDWVGQWRRVDLIRKEPVLQGRPLPYVPFPLIEEMLDYEFGHEERRQASYAHANKHEIAISAFDFVSRLWQIHPFRAGNTRTVAVFAILYFEWLGFTVSSEAFTSDAQFFRDALVLDNTLDPGFRDSAPLRRFMEKALFEPSIELAGLRTGLPVSRVLD